MITTVRRSKTISTGFISSNFDKSLQDFDDKTEEIIDDVETQFGCLCIGIQDSFSGSGNDTLLIRRIDFS